MLFSSYFPGPILRPGRLLLAPSILPRGGVNWFFPHLRGLLDSRLWPRRLVYENTAEDHA